MQTCLFPHYYIPSICHEMPIIWWNHFSKLSISLRFLFCTNAGSIRKCFCLPNFLNQTVLFIYMKFSLQTKIGLTNMDLVIYDLAAIIFRYIPNSTHEMLVKGPLFIFSTVKNLLVVLFSRYSSWKILGFILNRKIVEKSHWYFLARANHN